MESANESLRSFTAKDEFGTSFEFHYRDDTMLRLASGLSIRLDAHLDSGQRLPIVAGHKLRVEWKPSADKKKRIAARISQK